MEKTIIKTNNAPAAIGPYSQAVTAGELIYTSGQLPINPETGEIVTIDIKAAARQCLQNLQAILEACGSSMDCVVKTTVFLHDLQDFACFNEIYATFFTDKQPARTCVQANLPRNALIEMEAVALKKNKS